MHHRHHRQSGRQTIRTHARRVDQQTLNIPAVGPLPSDLCDFSNEKFLRLRVQTGDPLPAQLTALFSGCPDIPGVFVVFPGKYENTLPVPGELGPVVLPQHGVIPPQSGSVAGGLFNCRDLALPVGIARRIDTVSPDTPVEACRAEGLIDLQFASVTGPGCLTRLSRCRCAAYTAVLSGSRCLDDEGAAAHKPSVTPVRGDECDTAAVRRPDGTGDLPSGLVQRKGISALKRESDQPAHKPGPLEGKIRYHGGAFISVGGNRKLP